MISFFSGEPTFRGEEIRREAEEGLLVEESAEPTCSVLDVVVGLEVEIEVSLEDEFFAKLFAAVQALVLRVVVNQLDCLRLPSAQLTL